MRAELTQAVTVDPSVDNLIALAEVCFIWGDIRAKTADDKLAAYEQGRQAAKRAVELAPRSVTAHLWYAIDTGRWGQTKGLMRSLFLLPIMKEEIDTVLALDPKFPPAYSLAGYFYYEVPGMLGGDLDRAEKLFRTGLELDPTFTAMRVGLAKTLVKKGRAAEARKELEAVLAEKAPHNLADWTLKDSVEARQLLDAIRRRPGGGARDQPSRARERSRSSRWRRAMRRLTAGPRGGRRTRPPSTTARNAEEISSAPQAAPRVVPLVEPVEHPEQAEHDQPRRHVAEHPAPDAVGDHRFDALVVAVLLPRDRPHEARGQIRLLAEEDGEKGPVGDDEPHVLAHDAAELVLGAQVGAQHEPELAREALDGLPRDGGEHLLLAPEIRVERGLRHRRAAPRCRRAWTRGTRAPGRGPPPCGGSDRAPPCAWVHAPQST